MKLNHRKVEREQAALLLIALGINLGKQATYDCHATGRRYSVFQGRVSAVWDDSHFEKIPFGTFEVIG